ncbi:MAG: hypothetical protein ABI151_00680 [Chitinophagaceae bacterium]
MSRKSSYEEALPGKLDEIPLPDEDDSWEKMNKLLNEKRDRAQPFWFLRDYRMLGLLTILFIGCGIWLMTAKLNEDKIPNRSQEISADQAPPARNSGDELKTPVSASATKKDMGAGNKSSHADSASARSTRQTVAAVKIRAEFLPSMAKRKNKSVSFEARDPIKREPGNKQIAVTSSSRQVEMPWDSATTLPTYQNKTLHDSVITSAINKHKKTLQPTAEMFINNASIDSLATKEQLVKPGKPSYSKYLLSAGLGIQQQIQIGGQQSVKYGYKASRLVSDYIPSAWLTLERKNKWFLQTSFVYSSPRLVKEFAFDRHTKSDTLGLITSTLKLKKTFYSQLPLSANFYVKHNWSIGAGITFTWFRGAIAERETSIKNTATQTRVVKEIVPINSFTDSFLYRSHSFFTVQSDYQWKRISLGLKYSKDLQSYIKYTMPDGAVAEGRNWGLQAVLRVRLWQKELK